MTTSSSLRIVPALNPAQIELVRTVFREYAASLGVDLCFQDFDSELAGLPGEYSPPEGRLYLAYIEGTLAGCVAMRKWSADSGEMKRLYVRDGFRGHKVGRLLTERIVSDARVCGYRTLRLDTLPQMAHAIALYRSMGFKEIAPYRDNPVPGALFFELPV